MVNMKEKVYAALCSAHGSDRVSDSWPQSEEEIPCVVYTEEENKSHERSGTRTTKSYCRYRVDIFNFDSTSDATVKTDEALAWNKQGTGLGMTRTGCADDNRAECRHKVMRYECIVGESDGRIYGIN